VGRGAQDAERQRVVDAVAHDRPGGVRLELVPVMPEPVGAAHLRVDEQAIGLPGLDAGQPPQGRSDAGSAVDGPRHDLVGL
jgi:hypothetical protein